MGIEVEFNPDLALRAFGTEDRRPEECLPKELQEGVYRHFLKKGQRNYWLKGEIPLVETKGEQVLSRPLASIIIESATHYRESDGSIWTKGNYRVIKVFDPQNPTIHFEGLQILKRGEK